MRNIKRLSQSVRNYAYNKKLEEDCKKYICTFKMYVFRINLFYIKTKDDLVFKLDPYN